MPATTASGGGGGSKNTGSNSHNSNSSSSSGDADGVGFWTVGTTKSSVFNLCSATLGAGALSVPYAFSQTGVLLGVILLVIGAIATVFSIHLLLHVKELTGCLSYEHMTVHLCGHRMGVCVNVCIILFCVGTAVSYIVAVGDILAPITLLHVLPHWLNDRNTIMCVFWLCVMYPLSLFNKVNSLSWTSMFGVCSIFYLVLATCAHMFVDVVDADARADDPVELVSLTAGVFTALPIIMFAFTCQINVFLVQQEMIDPSYASMMRVSVLSILTSFSSYVCMGIGGYLDYRSHTQGNILNNYSVPQLLADGGVVNYAVVFAFLAITLAVVMAFPLNIFPARFTIEFMVFDGDNTGGGTVVSSSGADIEGGSDDDDNSGSSSSNGGGGSSTSYGSVGRGDDTTLVRRGNSGSADEHAALLSSKSPSSPQQPSPVMPVQTSTPLQRFLLTTSLCAGALWLAIKVPSLNIVFQLLGGTASAFVCFCIPAWFAITVDVFPGHRLHRVCCWSLLIGGVVVGALSTVMTLRQMME